MDTIKVLISGCHAGPNPSPGLGIARSLRLAYPGAFLVAKDHSAHSSGLHDPAFDDVWMCRPWDELDLERHRRELTERLDRGFWFIPGLDLEVRWFGQTRARGALMPAARALERAGKPAFAAAERLPVSIPPWARLSSGEQTVHRFCREQDWRVWVKGPDYEARRVRKWEELQRAAADLRDTWGTDDLFVQGEITGWEVSVAYAGHEGRLLDAVFMEKRSLTAEGKTWSGAVGDVPPRLRAALAGLLGEVGWTGGGELEFIRDPAGALWLIDWNPRFPAWIFGATLAGRNLPARLLAAAAGVAGAETPFVSGQFTRVVHEIPIRPGLPLPPPPPAQFERTAGGKHPSGMPLLMRRLARNDRAPAPTTPDPFPDALGEDLREAAARAASTPCRVLLPRTSRHAFEAASRFSRQMEERIACKLRIAYSVKTNPAPEFMRLARAQNFLAEVISTAELRWALQAGFPGGQVIYNGPVPLFGGEGGAPLRAIFADSLPAFRRYTCRPPASTVGVRVRPPFLDSRFGVALENPEQFRDLVDAVRGAPAEVAVGISLHVQSSEVGPGRWLSLVRSVLGFASSIQKLADRRLGVLNLGGGFVTGDLQWLLSEGLPRLARDAELMLSGLREVIVEPGKALAEPCAALLSSVLEVRDLGKGVRAAVVDASIAEAPCIHRFPHRCAVYSGGRIYPLGPGRDMVFGRLCMEGDVLMAGIRLPSWVAPGHKVAVCDSGAYDASMSYPFGTGSIAHDFS